MIIAPGILPCSWVTGLDPATGIMLVSTLVTPPLVRLAFRGVAPEDGIGEPAAETVPTPTGG